MKKVLIAVATAIIAVTTMFSSPADAGFKVRIGLGLLGAKLAVPYEPRRLHHRKYRKRKHRAAKRKTYAKKRSSKPAAVAKVNQAAKAAPVVDNSENENSTISTAMLDTEDNTAETTPVAEKAVEEKTAEATSVTDTGNQLSCKKFFPAVGMTLTVPCE